MSDEHQHETVTAELLRGLFLFEALDEGQLAWLAERSRLVVVDAGEPVYRQGEPAEAVWLLLEGELRLLRSVGGEDVGTHFPVPAKKRAAKTRRS